MGKIFCFVKLTVVLLMLISCKSQSVNKLQKDCEIIETKNKIAFEEFISQIDETEFYKLTSERFERVKTGILFYKKYSNNKFGKIILIQSEENELKSYKINSYSQDSLNLKLIVRFLS